MILLLLITLQSHEKLHAQEDPPRPIAVYISPAQGLSLGAFSQSMLGGTVIVYADGSRSVTGDIIQLNLGYTYSPALFEVEGNRGTLVSVILGPDVTLAGSNGGSMTLRLDDPYPESPFVITSGTPDRMLVRIGGTLTVGNPAANPPGSYNGTFWVTFNQE